MLGREVPHVARHDAVRASIDGELDEAVVVGIGADRELRRDREDCRAFSDVDDERGSAFYAEVAIELSTADEPVPKLV